MQFIEQGDHYIRHCEKCDAKNVNRSREVPRALRAQGKDSGRPRVQDPWPSAAETQLAGDVGKSCSVQQPRQAGHQNHPTK
jgi:hypothetical protein